ncbi:MAG: hypothetical protein QOI54_2101 [Actinomycetota bacterium]|nr:hypothetical protein [Actinomycetota bacterium]
MCLDHTELVHLGSDEAALVSRLLADAPLDRPVPSCPGWLVRDLVGHLGSVHRWATEVVRTGGVARPPEPPSEDAQLAPWFAQGAAGLTTTLAGADPSAGCWTFAPPHRVGFWSRRQLHETTVHRWDLEAALGRDSGLDPRLAADGIDEVVTMFFPRQVRLGREAPLTDVLALVDNATGRRWVLAGDGTTDVDGTPDATVTGDAADLLLLLWQRHSLDDGAVGADGSREAAERVLSARLTP